METSTLLGILGITVSCIFGAWGVYLVIKHRYPGRLTYVREQSIALFDSIVKNLPELAVLYKDKPVRPNLVLVKGALVNTGKKDVTPTMVETPIRISMPEGFKWLTAKVISTSKDVKASIQIIDEQTLLVTNGLLRCKEFVQFQVLAEVPVDDGSRKTNETKKPSFTEQIRMALSTHSHSKNSTIEQRLDHALKFSHRIEDTRQINTVELKEDERVKKRMKLFAIIPIVGLIACIAISSMYYFKAAPSIFVYSFLSDSTHVIPVMIKSLREKEVRLKSLDDSYDVTLSLDEFFARCKDHPSTTVDTSEAKFELTLLFVVYILLPGALLSLRYREYRFKRRLRLLLSQEENNG